VEVVMRRHTGNVHVGLALMALAAIACGGVADATGLAPTPLITASPTPQAATSTSAGCEAPAIEIELGLPVSSEIRGSDQPPGEIQYFCVSVPEGTAALTFELSGATADLNLFVGHPDLATVQEGGVWFWSSTESGAEDEVIVVEPALADAVNPGHYYVEVSAEDFRDSSPFTLLVSVP
jgi:hypothetical protein